MRISRILAIGVLTLTSATANANTVSVFTALIDGMQANMGLGTGSPGLGAATMTFDHDTNEFSWFVAWENLLGDTIAAHFHGPALPNQNAGVEVTIDHLVNPSIGSAILTGAQQEALFAGLWYINIHTTVNKGGEIRGQVNRLIPIPAAAWLMATALVMLGGLARVRR